MHAEPHGVFKPSLSYYRKLIKLADLSPPEVVMIGDRLFQDILGANRAGINSVLVDKLGPIKWWDRIVSIPDFVLPYLFKRRYRDV